MSASSGWTLVTVTYNSSREFRNAWGNGVPDGVRWMVVDNASNDGSAELAAELGADVLALQENVGFSAANNVALRQVDSEWVLFANPDLHVGAVGDLRRLASVSTANSGALVAPQLLNADGSEQANARGYPYLADKAANRSLRLPGSSLHDYARVGLDGPTYVAWVMGAAVAGPTSTLARLGGWDDDFFIYYEDHDLPLRAWLAGVATVVDPSVRWTHEWQRSTKRLRVRPWMHDRSMRRFYAKYPDLLTRRRMAGSARWDNLSAQLWTPANERG